MKHEMILGPANIALCQALNLKPGASLDEMIVEIERLKKEAVKKERSSKKEKITDGE